MKHAIIVAAIILSLGNSAASEQLSLFGLDNEILSNLFLQEALDIAQSNNLQTRNLFLEDGSALLDPSGFYVLQLAYRADAEATLDLIQRILDASQLR